MKAFYYMKHVRGTFGNRDEHGKLQEKLWLVTSAGAYEKGGK